jgi:inhibitor of cysteine peptidase
VKPLSRNTLIAIGVAIFIVGALIPLLTLPLQHPSLSEKTQEKPTLIEGPGEQSTRVVLSASQLEGYRDLVEKISAQAKLAIYSLQRGFTSMQVPLVILESQTYVLPLSARITPSSQPARPEYSLTNVQVMGVDEEDIVKTNGYVIAIAREGDIAIIDASEKRVLSYINTTNVKGLYLLDNNILVVIRADLSLEATVPEGVVKYPLVDILVYDLTQPSSPTLLHRVNVTCKFGGSRLIGKYLYVVGYLESFSYTENDTVIPLIPLVNGRLIPREYITETGNYTSYIVILALDALSGEYTVKAYTGGRVEWIYMVEDRLYVAWSSDLTYYNAVLKVLEYLESKGLLSSSKREELKTMLEQGALNRVLSELREVVKNLGSFWVPIEGVYVTDETFFLVLNISDLAVSERGVFKVPGVVLDQFALEELRSEYGRFLVVATTVHTYSLTIINACPIEALPIVIITIENITTTTITAIPPSTRQWCPEYVWLDMWISYSSNSVYVVDDNLTVVSKLEGLAIDERVYAARLIKSTLYLVTFRVIDPLFAIDLTNPYSPRVLGYLKIPGFSEYLHPLTDNYLIGVGLEDLRLKISLFNVTDPTNMSEVAKLLLGYYTWSEVLVNHRAFMIDYRHNIVVIPVTVNWRGEVGGFIVVGYSVENSSLKIISVVQLEKPMRALYIGSDLYLVGYSRVLVYRLPDLELVGDISY